MNELKKLKQANDNIKRLINTILQFKMDSKNGYCYYPTERYDNDWNCDKRDCNDCKNKYYNELKEELQDEYLIK